MLIQFIRLTDASELFLMHVFLCHSSRHNFFSVDRHFVCISHCRAYRCLIWSLFWYRSICSARIHRWSAVCQSKNCQPTRIFATPQFRSRGYGRHGMAAAYRPRSRHTLDRTATSKHIVPQQPVLLPQRVHSTFESQN
ncbi:hypothetical protein EG68_08655 [Paragonimus skrjabini miyazakii]|uniref:Uncharacterized protein n=1 Tax=Paragonimus skrjabini miyazakii TaxID=59628 RepID=A0A8S9YIE8_9TREM|nr:hypothetical protein EG68_08655 [Paragonimus skrjabini miyazakii]